MEDESILGGASSIADGIAEAGGAAMDFAANVGSAQIASAAAFGDTMMAGADRMVSGAAYAAGMDDTAQEYRSAANDWAQSRDDNLDIAAQSYADAGRDVWGNNPPSLPDVGMGGSDNPAVMDMGMSDPGATSGGGFGGDGSADPGTESY